MNVKLTPQQKIKLLNAEDIFSIMQKILLRENKIDRDKEHFWIIGLASSDRLLFVELVSLGSATETVIEPMKVFRVAVMRDAAKAVLVRNHPTLELESSMQERDVCDRLIQVGRILNVPVVDHLVITPHTYQSFEAIGLFAPLTESLKWVPGFEVAEKMAEEAHKIRTEEAKLRAAALKLAKMEMKAALKRADEKKQEAVQKKAQELVIEALEAKYDVSPPTRVKRTVKNTTDLARLTDIHRVAIRSISLIDFANWLEQTS